MRSLLEKAIVHLLNGDQDKAETLFHRFMVERARGIHESLRQQDDAQLNEGWDHEIQEEEYFDDLDDEKDDDGVVGAEGAADAPPVDDEGADDLAVGDDDDLGDDLSGEADDLGAEGDLGGEGGLDTKLDDIEAKMDELSAQFDELMAKYDDDGDAGDLDGIGDADGDDLGDLDGDGDNDAVGKDESDLGDAGDDTDDLADRMEDDMADEDEDDEDHLAMSEASDDGDEDGDGESDNDDDEMLDEMLSDITESVLDELEKVSVATGGEGREVGDGKSAKVGKSGILPSHGVKDRVDQAKPFAIKAEGDSHNDGMERETAPKVRDQEKRRNNDAGVKSLKPVANRKNQNADTKADYVGAGSDRGGNKMSKPTKTKLPIDGGRKVY